jgi:hypothetical protein
MRLAKFLAILGGLDTEIMLAGRIAAERPMGAPEGLGAA